MGRPTRGRRSGRERRARADACLFMPDATTTIADLKEAVRRFAAERSWEPYHSPKNLAMALASEVGALLEPFRWADSEPSRHVGDDPQKRLAGADELADVACLLF